MTEGTTDPAITVEPDAGQPTPPLVNADGELREGWRDTLPEEIRSEKVFDRVSNFEGIMKSLAGAEKVVGRDKVLIPNDASSDVEWDAYYAAGGRPKTAGDYNLTRPEELPEEFYNTELATAAQELFHKIGLSKKQADALFKFNNDNTIAQIAKKVQDSKLAMEDLKSGLISEWGNAFEQKKHLGNVAVEQGASGDEEFKERITQKFGNDPDFIRYSANLGGKFAEAGGVKPEMVPTPADIQDSIDKEMASPAYGLDYAKHGFTKAQHKTAVAKVARLFQEKTKHVKTG